jgi:arabinogalactan oligomer/maltooligosaccharide transport system substrate-binding protein
MKRFTHILLAVLVAATLLLAACGQSSPAAAPTAPGAAEPTKAAPAAEPTAAPAAEPTKAAEPTPAPDALGSGSSEIVIWHGWQGDYYEAIKQAFADYASKNNVKITLLRVPDLNNKVQVAVPSGQGPDIIAWVNDQIGKNALSGTIQPLDSLGIDAAYLAQNFTDVASSAMVYDGKAYGVPESLEAITFIYNKKLIQTADLPTSTDDLIARAKAFNGPDKYLFVYSSKDAYFSAPWWQGAGVTLVTPDGKTELSSDKGLKAAELIKSFSTIMPKEIDYGVADTLFKEGKAAIIMNGPWAIADYQKSGLDVGLATVPVVSSSGQPGQPFVGVKLLMLAANAKNPTGAVELMKYYGSAEVQAKLAQVNKQVPANKAAQEQVKSDPIIAGFIAQAANGKPLPNTQFIDAMWDPISKTLEAIWTGASPPDQAIKDGATLFDEKAQDLK